MKAETEPKSVEAVRLYLVGKDWRCCGGSFGREVWYKRVWYGRCSEVIPRCLCNDSKPGIQVVLSFHEFQGRMSYELDVTGQKPDGVWVKLCAYGIGEEILDVLDSQTQQLIAAWTVLATTTRERNAE